MMGFFQWIRQRWSRSGKTHEVSGMARPPLKAGGHMAVRRFQGRFTCGCTWPEDKLAPEECPAHPGAERVYMVERTEQLKNVEVEIPPELQEA